MSFLCFRAFGRSCEAMQRAFQIGLSIVEAPKKAVDGPVRVLPALRLQLGLRPGYFCPKALAAGPYQGILDWIPNLVPNQGCLFQHSPS